MGFRVAGGLQPLAPPGPVYRLELIIHTKGKPRRELAYAATSLPPAEASRQRPLVLWQGHWGIENRVHWVRDVTFDEDRSQVRTGSAPQIMAALRNLTSSVIRLAGETNITATCIATTLPRLAFSP